MLDKKDYLEDLLKITLDQLYGPYTRSLDVKAEIQGKKAYGFVRIGHPRCSISSRASINGYEITGTKNNVLKFLKEIIVGAELLSGIGI